MSKKQEFVTKSELTGRIFVIESLMFPALWKCGRTIGHPEIQLCMDEATGYVLSWRIGGRELASELFLAAIASHGMEPDAVVVDAGTPLSPGLDLLYPKTRWLHESPMQPGRIERHLRQLESGFQAACFPGVRQPLTHCFVERVIHEVISVYQRSRRAAWISGAGVPKVEPATVQRTVRDSAIRFDGHLYSGGYLCIWECDRVHIYSAFRPVLRTADGAEYPFVFATPNPRQPWRNFTLQMETLCHAN